MKNFTLLLIFVFIFAQATHAQEDAAETWKSSGTIGLNFSQSHLSNWAAGGENALNWQGVFNYSINYAKNKEKWDNGIALKLGYSYLGDAKAIKTDDQIELNSLYGYKATEKLFYSLAFSFKSQFAEGFDYKNDSTTPISKFLAPGYITLGLGMEWVPNKNFSINFSPVTGRITIVNDQDLADAGAFGVEKATYDANTGAKLSDGKTSRFEFGTKATAKLNIELAPNVQFTSKLELFSDYLDNPQNIDLDWQNLITMKVNSWLNANISAHMIYDDNINITDKDGNTGPRLQLKEVFSLGLSYNFK